MNGIEIHPGRHNNTSEWQVKVIIGNRLIKQIMMLMAFAAFLAWLVVNAGPVWQVITRFVSFFNALLMGIAIAFILNRPCMYIDDHLGLKENKPALNRGLAVLLTYMAVLVILAVLTMFVVPQIIDSIQQFIQRVSIYAANSQAWIDRITGTLRLQSVDVSSLTDQLLGSIKGFTDNLSGMVSSIVGNTAGVNSFLFNLVEALIFSIYLALRCILDSVVLQLLECNVIFARVVGGSLGLPGIWVLLATIVGSGLAGPLGILLGVPIATVLYTLLKNDVHQREILEEF